MVGYAAATHDPATNTAIVRRFFDEVCNARRLDAARTLFAEGHRYYSSFFGAGSAGKKR